MARKRLMYIELKTGYEGDGPAWISRVTYTKSEKGFHFHGRLLQEASPDQRREHGWTEGNYFDFTSGKAYWASGAKADQSDRLIPGAGELTVDEDIKDAYAKLIGDK